jgi:hypothetical protein
LPVAFSGFNPAEYSFKTPDASCAVVIGGQFRICATHPAKNKRGKILKIKNFASRIFTDFFLLYSNH